MIILKLEMKQPETKRNQNVSTQLDQAAETQLLM